MGSIVLTIVGIILLIGLAGALKESELGRIFLFAIFMIIVCNIFGAFIPFSEMISSIFSFVAVAIIIYFGYNIIFNK